MRLQYILVSVTFAILGAATYKIYSDATTIYHEWRECTMHAASEDRVVERISKLQKEVYGKKKA
jgi:hypothetical protein